ncbi:MAG: sugar phosphate nucleotidyltransferase [archaeon]|nr:sugar phosphate nucleotidyltransferase [archaeon]
MLNLKGMKAVITAGGMGTRLLPFSKEIPKEMSPILTKNSGETIFVKPVIQAIFEQLYDCGIRDFLAVVGRGKRAIEDHFTPDQAFVSLLRQKGKNVDALTQFYDKIISSNLVFIIQAEPLGFGDAVLKTKDYVSEEFVVHAGDTYLISPHNEYLERLTKAHKEFDAEATILLQDVKDPWNYGIVTGKDFTGGIMEIENAVEKPSNFISKTAIMPIYIFKESIFQALEKISIGKGGEIQLTDAIQKLISEGRKVMGVKLTDKDFRLDIGSPETLMDALAISSQHLGGNGTDH